MPWMNIYWVIHYFVNTVGGGKDGSLIILVFFFFVQRLVDLLVISSDLCADGDRLKNGKRHFLFFFCFSPSFVCLKY